MGGGGDEIIMTSTSNPEVLAVCYAQGWAAHADYMTKSEAEAVSSLGTVFRSASIVHFDELQYFTGISSVAKVFQTNSTLEYITMPATLSEIGESACNGCSNLKRLVILSGPTKIRNSAFSGCTSLTDISIGEGVTTIYGDSAFGGCTSLESATLPSTIASIGNMCFYNDSNLSEVTILAATPPTLSYNPVGNRGFIRGTKSSIIVYVPADSVNDYKAAPYWSDIAAKIQPIGGGSNALIISILRGLSAERRAA